MALEATRTSCRQLPCDCCMADGTHGLASSGAAPLLFRHFICSFSSRLQQGQSCPLGVERGHAAVLEMSTARLV